MMIMLLGIDSEALVLRLNNKICLLVRKEVNMNILFLDLSTKSTGYCISDDAGKMITYGLITASSENNISRIVKIQTEIIKLIQ